MTTLPDLRAIREDRPTFFILGANRGGTTALYKELDRHPQVFMSANKEPGFFVWDGEDIDLSSPDATLRARYTINTWEKYCALFAGSNAYPAAGEGSTGYLTNYLVPARIHRRLPDAKLIAVLRDPADRAFSHYALHRLFEFETRRDFGAIVRQEIELHRRGKPSERMYLDLGMYSIGLAAYLELFDRSQLYACLYEDWRNHPARTLGEIYRFLGVDESLAPPPSIEDNESYMPRNKWLDNLLSRRAARGSVAAALGLRLFAANRGKLKLADEDRLTLTEFFREEILRLQVLLDRDLSAWLLPRGAKK